MKLGNLLAAAHAATRRPGDRAPADEGGHREATGSPRFAVISVFFLFNLAFLILFADRDGYEGDDLNTILPMFHLDEAKLGNIELYRYAWQSLAYEFGASIFKIFGSPEAIFLLAPIFAATSLTLMLIILWERRSDFGDLLLSLIALASIPELWFSGLYFNSTILGMPFAVAAWAIVRRDPSDILIVAAAILLVVAMMMRLDFILTAPALAVASWQANRSLRRPVLLAATVSLVLVFLWSTNILNISEIVETYSSAATELVVRAHENGWDRTTKILVMSVAVSPIGWAILLFGGIILVRRYFSDDIVNLLFWSVALLPLLIPIRNLLSIKYLLPLFVFLPVFTKLCIMEIRDRFSGPSRSAVVAALAVGTASFFLFSVSLSGGRPFLEIGALASRPIGTHDGLRSYGGYLWQMAAMDMPAPQAERRRIARQIFEDVLDPEGPDVLVVGEETFFSPGSVGWRHLQLALEKAGFRGVVVAPGTIVFEIHDRRLVLSSMRDIDELLLRHDRGNGLELHDFRRSDAR